MTLRTSIDWVKPIEVGAELSKVYKIPRAKSTINSSEYQEGVSLVSKVII